MSSHSFFLFFFGFFGWFFLFMFLLEKIRFRFVEWVSGGVNSVVFVLSLYLSCFPLHLTHSVHSASLVSWYRGPCT